jgi:hypothetical protein
VALFQALRARLRSDRPSGTLAAGPNYALSQRNFPDNRQRTLTTPIEETAERDDDDEDEKDWMKKRTPPRLSPGGVHKLWRCPTLAQPRDALPLGLQRFTSVFGMGTGGTTAL